MDVETKRRLADNEALYRSVNEQIKKIGHGLGGRNHLYEFICECADISCSMRIPATLAEYERVRAEPDRFVVITGHEIPEIERVVDRNQRFLTVAKIGEAVS